METCIRIGKELVRRYEAYNDAERQISETLLQLKVLWDRSEMQMDIVKKMWDSLEESHRQNQIMLLNILETKLHKATLLLDNTIGRPTPETVNLGDLLKRPGKLRKSRYALSVQENLVNVVAEFKEWHTIFDPSWYLLAKLTSDKLDTYLATNKSSGEGANSALITLRKALQNIKTPSKASPKDMSSNDDFLGIRTPIPASCAMVSKLKDNDRSAIVDCMTPNPFADIEATTKDVKALSKALKLMDPFTFGLLRCCGVINRSRFIEDEQLIQFDLVFVVPQGLSDPQSLRNLVRQPPPSLNLRLSIGRQLAASILYLYTVGFVHKNIRPETILLFSKENSTDKPTFLVGFECFRMRDTDTNLFGDTVLEREIYRHPSRQGHKPKEMYKLEHDVYSLGVCLLEFGLWTSFVLQCTSEGGFLPGEKLKVIDFVKHGFKHSEQAPKVKRRFLNLAQEELPIVMGRKYANVVVDCLTCLDVNGPWAQIEDSDSDEIDAGVRFIENVLTELQEITL